MTPPNVSAPPADVHFGGCLCGTVRFRVAGPLEPIQVCHCAQCRKAHGGPFAAVLPVQTACFALLSGAEALQAYPSSPGKERVFCRTCGSPVLSRRPGRPDVVRIRAGLLDEPLSVRVGSHQHVASACAWWRIEDDGTPRFDGAQPSLGSAMPNPAAAAPPAAAAGSRSFDRFLQAQDGVFDGALAELAAGRKRGHWIWFVLPQLRGLGRSETAQAYGLAGRAEAAAYAAHPVLGARLVAAVRALLGHRDRTAVAMLGEVDAMKLRSCLTLFAAVAPGEPCFGDALAMFFDGAADERTLALLQGDGSVPPP